MEQKVVMTITLTPPYNVQVQFPADPMVCTFMLSEAKKAVDKWFAEQSDKLIQPATTLLGNGNQRA